MRSVVYIALQTAGATPLRPEPEVSHRYVYAGPPDRLSVTVPAELSVRVRLVIVPVQSTKACAGEAAAHIRLTNTTKDVPAVERRPFIGCLCIYLHLISERNKNPAVGNSQGLDYY